MLLETDNTARLI